MTNEERNIFRNAAFPFKVLTPDATEVAPGMSKRELFAVMIMQGLVSDGKTLEAFVQDTSVHTIVSVAVQAADVLIAELAKVQP